MKLPSLILRLSRHGILPIKRFSTLGITQSPFKPCRSSAAVLTVGATLTVCGGGWLNQLTNSSGKLTRGFSGSDAATLRNGWPFGMRYNSLEKQLLTRKIGDPCFRELFPNSSEYTQRCPYLMKIASASGFLGTQPPAALPE